MNRLVDDLERYRVFHTVAKAGSLTRAAAELFISQPAVTHSIKQLEAQLGGPLFVRTSKGVKLNAEGEMLFRHVDRAFQSLDDGERALADSRELIAGDIRIGASDTLCKIYLLPLLKQYRDAFPHIRIQVTNRTSAETIGLLKAGRVDFGIVNLPTADTGGLVIRESMVIEDVFVAGPDDGQWAERRRMTLEALSRQPLLLLERGSAIRAYIDAYAERHGVMLRPAIELGSLDLLVDFAKAGFGIACAVKPFIAEPLRKGELVELEVDPPIPPRAVGIVTRRDAQLTKAAVKWMEMFG